MRRSECNHDLVRLLWRDVVQSSIEERPNGGGTPVKQQIWDFEKAVRMAGPVGFGGRLVLGICIFGEWAQVSKACMGIRRSMVLIVLV